MSEDWIYRLYIDEFFVSGFKFNPHKTEKSIYNSISSNSDSEEPTQEKYQEEDKKSKR